MRCLPLKFNLFHLVCFFLCFVLCTHEQYELRLVAGDGRNENETVVVIHVNDKNDLPPAFNHPMYEASLEEESQGPFPINLLQVNFLFASVIAIVKSLASLSLSHWKQVGWHSAAFRGFHPFWLINSAGEISYLPTSNSFYALCACSLGNIIRVNFLCSYNVKHSKGLSLISSFN